MKQKLLLLAAMAFLNFSYSDPILVGRGGTIDVSVWNVKKGTLGEKQTIVDKAEVFTAILSEKGDTLYLGGTFNNAGTLWKKNLKTGEVTAEEIPLARTVYSLILSKEGVLYAAGTHHYLGGGIWKKSPDGEWEQFGIPVNSSVIYSLVIDKKGRIFASGAAGAFGKVWVYDNSQWSRGQELNGSREINTLCVSGDTIYAAGKKADDSAGIWTFQGESWKTGDNLKFATAVYTSTVTPDGYVYLGGAGKENKVLWENSQGFWNAVELEDCLALYALYSDSKGNIITAGWNKKRKGRVWFKNKKNWDKGQDIENCFVIRSVT